MWWRNSCSRRFSSPPPTSAAAAARAGGAAAVAASLLLHLLRRSLQQLLLGSFGSSSPRLALGKLVTSLALAGSTSILCSGVRASRRGRCVDRVDHAEVVGGRLPGGSPSQLLLLLPSRSSAHSNTKKAQPPHRRRPPTPIDPAKGETKDRRGRRGSTCPTASEGRERSKAE